MFMMRLECVGLVSKIDCLPPIREAPFFLRQSLALPISILIQSTGWFVRLDGIDAMRLCNGSS
jgi:hypothetical protein